MVTMAWFSRPVAHHCAPPSKAAPPGFEPSTCGPEPRMLPITPESIGKGRGIRTLTIRFWRPIGTTYAVQYGGCGSRTHVIGL